jgi:aspartyl-tRNA(Asn)/glutamyl-tRNA(Gln) amidotransferase subunit B
MEEGSLRCDANVSVRPKGQKEFGTRAEIKNMNSFRFARQAIDYEIRRQIALLEKGEKVVQETRLWDVTENRTRSMRSKEEAHDYRYFPEPDLVPIVLDGAYVARVKAELPEMPADKRARFSSQYGLSAYDAGVLTDTQALADWFEAGAKDTKNPKGLANWMMGDMAAQMKEAGVDLAGLKFSQKQLASLVALVDEGAISSKQAKDVFLELFQTGKDPAAIVKEKGMAQVSDPAAIEKAVEKVLGENPNVVADYKGGKQGVIGFLVGKVMKETGGKANPKLVNETLRRKLDA